MPAGGCGGHRLCDFLSALKPLVEHRQSQGHRFGYISSLQSAEAIRTAIRQAAGRGRAQARASSAMPNRRPARCGFEPARLCVHLHKAVVNVKWGSEPQIASDNWYADLDDDHLPDVAIGRIPADSPAELTKIVGKILAYESNADFGVWRQRVNFIAGVGGFSPIIDGVLETATSKLLTSGIPAAYETRMTYGSWTSPYCPDPRLFHDTAVERHNEGCLFWVYIGHGHSTGLDRVSIPGERFHIFDCDDCSKLQCTSGSPIAIMLASTPRPSISQRLPGRGPAPGGRRAGGRVWRLAGDDALCNGRDGERDDAGVFQVAAADTR
jgi:hypothetical protein